MTVGSNRQHLSNDDYLDKGKDCHNYFVLCCVCRIYTMIHTHEQFLKLSFGLGLVFVCLGLAFCAFSSV